MENNIPSDAKKVFSGIRTNIYQWDQEMYDGSIKIFERVQFINGAFVVAILTNGRILITRQEQPARKNHFIWLPGWAFDSPSEDPLHCAERELREETWYTSDNIELWYKHNGTSNIISYTYFYIAYDCYKIGEIEPDPGERIELMDVSFDEFLLLSEDDKFIHWPLLPILFSARIHADKYQELKKEFRIE